MRGIRKAQRPRRNQSLTSGRRLSLASDGTFDQAQQKWQVEGLRACLAQVCWKLADSSKDQSLKNGETLVSQASFGMRMQLSRATDVWPSQPTAESRRILALLMVGLFVVVFSCGGRWWSMRKPKNFARRCPLERLVRHAVREDFRCWCREHELGCRKSQRCLPRWIRPMLGQSPRSENRRLRFQHNASRRWRVGQWPTRMSNSCWSAGLFPSEQQLPKGDGARERCAR